MASARILLFGANGQVGHELVCALAPLGLVQAIDRQDCDLSEAGTAAAQIMGTAPSLVVNAAAYTAVDRAEEEPAVARAVNAEAVAEMAQTCAKKGIPFVHYSTDYVFDGSATAPYEEDDEAAPLGVYGATKWQGEEAIRAASGPHLILRTAWVYGIRGRNFLLTMQRLARDRDELRVVDDQTGAPTHARAIAGGTAQILAALRDDGAWQEKGGTYHLTAVGATTWCGFAQAIVEFMAKSDDRFSPPKVTGIPSSDYPTPARRPAYSVLSNEKLNRTFGFVLPDWRDQLAEAIAEQAYAG